MLNKFFFRSESAEEGEIESDSEMLNPMVTLTKIDPTEIPEVSHKFLMRDDRRRDNKETEKNGDQQKEKNFGWSKRSVPQSKSGRTIKGRGNFRYRTPSRSRSRSFTPEHWKAAQRNVIKMNDFERLEEQKKVREVEMNRRAEERKKRHEALSKGDGKKSFFDVSSKDVPEPTVITVASSLTRPEKSGSVDLNALDYENDSDREGRDIVKNFRKLDDKNGKSESFSRSRGNKSRSRSRSVKRRSRSRDRFDREKRDFRPAVRNRFNDTRQNNRRWDKPQGGIRSRLGEAPKRRSKDRRSVSRSKSGSRSR